MHRFSSKGQSEKTRRIKICKEKALKNKKNTGEEVRKFECDCNDSVIEFNFKINTFALY